MRALRVLLRLGGELAVTAGALVLLFLVWQLWWTDVHTGRQVADEVAAVSSSLAAEPPGRGSGSAGSGSAGSGSAGSGSAGSGAAGNDSAGSGRDGETGTGTAASGLPEEVIGLVHLPTLGEQRVVRSGVERDVLDQGVLGHYPETAGPGKVGNFALAGHRTTYSAPLWAIDELAQGDPVVVETRDSFHVYRVERSRIVAPDQVEVLAPVPDRPGEEPEQASMVLTTCHPRFSAAQRYVAYAGLDRSVPREDGPPPELAEADTGTAAARGAAAPAAARAA
ncbi:class E sortase [Ornithinicoccus halotolerans]|uniref:class E sortase n=1 Tax=Ornithinicoccus halotolerans TaxID=1748220 RepID=UPI0012966F6E|nr:class E sortase [Ornithinicoccus halotolerans]